MIKYKLIKEYPASPKLGTVLSWYSSFKELFSCEYNKEINARNYKNANNYKIQLKDVIHYCEHWEQIENFKEGEYVLLNDNSKEYHNKVLKIIKVKYNTTCYFNWNGNEESFQSDTAYVRLATNEEIIRHYEEQGWVKGAKFRCGGDEDTVSELQYCNGNVHVKFKETNEWKEIHYCKLIKEPDYPKSWDDVKYLIEDEMMLFSKTYKISITDMKETFNFINKLKHSTEKQAQSSLAFAQLTQLHKVMIDKYNEFYNTKWKPEYRWEYIKVQTNEDVRKWVVNRNCDKLEINYVTTRFQHLAFPTKELAEFSLQHHNSLWKQYYELN